MKKVISSITLLSFLLYSTSALSDERAVIYPIKLNEISPFEGLLLSPAAVATIISDKKISDERCKLQVDKCTEKAKIDLVAQEERLKLDAERSAALVKKEQDDFSSKLKILESEIKKKDEIIQQQDGNNNTTYYAAGGFIMGIITVLAASKIFN